MEGVGVPEEGGSGFTLRGSDYRNKRGRPLTPIRRKPRSPTPAPIPGSNGVSVMVTRKLTLANTY